MNKNMVYMGELTTEEKSDIFTSLFKTTGDTLSNIFGNTGQAPISIPGTNTIYVNDPAGKQPETIPIFDPRNPAFIPVLAAGALVVGLIVMKK